MVTSPYSSQAISGYNSSPPADDGTQAASNQLNWSKHKTKLADPIKTLAESINSQTNSALTTMAGWFDSVLPHNFIRNPDFSVAQRGTSFTSTTTPANNDDQYLLDGWILLADGNDTVDVTQSTAQAPDGAYAAIALDVETANRKFGICQVIEARDSEKILGGTVSLAFQAKISGSSITKLRAMVATWSSTADSVTSDIVSAWGAQGTNPTLAANWTAENTAVDLTAPTTSYQSYEIEGISLDTASGTNVAVFIWCDNTTTTLTDFLYISNVKLIRGSDAILTVQARTFEQELEWARRFFRRFPTDAAGVSPIAAGYNQSTTLSNFVVPLTPAMRIAPAVSFSAAGDFTVNHQASATDTTGMATIAGRNTVDEIFLQSTVAAGLTAGEGCLLHCDAAAKYIELTAEL